MRKIILCSLLLPLLAPRGVSADAFDEFTARARNELLKPFARDLGAIMGASSLQPGRPFGFPGFEAGVVGGMQFRPNSDNRILKDAGVKAFGLPMVHAGVGLPFNVDLVVHGMSVEDVKVLGAGVRYGLFKSGLVTKFLPSVGISAFYDKLDHDAFKAGHVALNASASWDLPLVAPFVGVGFDSTKVEVKTAAAPGVTGLDATASGSRVAAGLELTPFPFMRLRGSYMLLNKNPGAGMALLVKF